MIALPKDTIAAVTAPTSASSMIKFHPIAEQHKPKVTVERRLAASRRQQQSQRRVIERRVAGDRRHPSFSHKA